MCARSYVVGKYTKSLDVNFMLLLGQVCSLAQCIHAAQLFLCGRFQSWGHSVIETLHVQTLEFSVLFSHFGTQA